MLVSPQSQAIKENSINNSNHHNSRMVLYLERPVTRSSTECTNMVKNSYVERKLPRFSVSTKHKNLKRTQSPITLVKQGSGAGPRSNSGKQSSNHPPPLPVPPLSVNQQDKQPMFHPRSDNEKPGGQDPPSRGTLDTGNEQKRQSCANKFLATATTVARTPSPAMTSKDQPPPLLSPDEGPVSGESLTSPLESTLQLNRPPSPKKRSGVRFVPDSQEAQLTPSKSMFTVLTGNNTDEDIKGYHINDSSDTEVYTSTEVYANPDERENELIEGVTRLNAGFDELRIKMLHLRDDSTAILTRLERSAQIIGQLKSSVTEQAKSEQTFRTKNTKEQLQLGKYLEHTSLSSLPRDDETSLGKQKNAQQLSCERPRIMAHEKFAERDQARAAHLSSSLSYDSQEALERLSVVSSKNGSNGQTGSAQGPNVSETVPLSTSPTGTTNHRRSFLDLAVALFRPGVKDTAAASTPMNEGPRNIQIRHQFRRRAKSSERMKKKLSLSGVNIPDIFPSKLSPTT
ncbi:unnamed protein product [Calicophoron daubneyi]|uniref:Uncharacterized protein n=1 Tax=Calicophoron daubneyi TaxID=300641 RepID=A0AAV2T457_CALDB